MDTNVETTTPVHCECVRIRALEKSGRLLALADVVIEIAGLTVAINSVRVEREKAGVSVRLPVDRDKRPLIDVADEIRRAMADVVLAAGIEAGILKETGTEEEAHSGAST